MDNLAGTAGGIFLALALIHSTAGLGNYAHWTVQFAASRRLPGNRGDARRISEQRAAVVACGVSRAGALLLRICLPSREKR